VSDVSPVDTGALAAPASSGVQYTETSRQSTPLAAAAPALSRRTVAGSRVFHATPRQCFRFSGFGPEAELNPAPFVSTGKNQINRVKYGGSTGAINHQSNHTADLSLS
jgi:hypothetical protein